MSLEHLKEEIKIADVKFEIYINDMISESHIYVSDNNRYVSYS